MTESGSRGEISPRRSGDTPSDDNKLDVSVTPLGDIDLSKLTDDQKRELILRHGEKAIEAKFHGVGIGLDVEGMDKKLDTVINKAQDAADAGAALTYTNVQDDSLGRTEIMIGTSDAAKAGKLTRSQSGLQDNQKILLIVAGAVVALILLILALK